MRLLSLITAIALIASPVLAASNVSAKFDGIYAGEAKPAPLKSAPACASIPIAEVRVAKGFLSVSKNPEHLTVTGLITAEGYVAAFLTRPGHSRSPMDGRYEENTIIAGLIESDSDCSWVVYLTRRP